MKQFFNKLLTLFMFLLAVACFYFGATTVFFSSFVNIALFIIAIFVLLQACGNIDKENGYGQYADKNNQKDETQS